MTQERLLRLPEVIRTTGLSRSSIYRHMQAGEFPSAVKVSAHASAWAQSEIQDWISARMAQRQR
mgnify:CR=1 FL=1